MSLKCTIETDERRAVTVLLLCSVVRIARAFSAEMNERDEIDAFFRFVSFLIINKMNHYRNSLRIGWAMQCSYPLHKRYLIGGAFG